MAIFDIDRFKEVNALVGHDGANDILKSVADSLKPRGVDKAFRHPEDADPMNERVVFRYGGDGFIILAFNTTVAGATVRETGKTVFRGIGMAEAMQKTVFDKIFSDLARERTKRGEAPGLTISAGLADTSPSLDPSDTPDRLTRRAELALIEAKRLTGNHSKKDEKFRGTITHWSLERDRS
jgi:GGDEF domain-containing protein